MKNLKLIIGDATNLDIASNSVDLIITHPPYLGVDIERYGGTSKDQINQSADVRKMLKLLNKATKEMFRVLKPSGHLIIANGPENCLDHRYLIQTIDKTGFVYADTIFQNSYSKEDSKNSETIEKSAITTWYHFIKGDEAYYNPYMVKRWNNPVWDLPFNNMEDSVDEIMSNKHHVLDVMNKEIPKRLIEMFSKKGYTVLDPFGGSAMVAVTAAELGRFGISNDISEDQNKAAIQRAKLTLGE